MTIPFDTLQYTKDAESVGFTREQAEFQAKTIMNVIKKDIATKRDLKELELSMNHDIALIRKDMLKMKNDIVIKLGGLVVISSGIIIGVLGFLVKI